MHTLSHSPRWQTQNGAVLVLALILMLMTGIVATTVMRTSISEVKMVANSQFREEAFQKTESVLNSVAAEKNNFVVTGDIGHRNCSDTSTDASCDANNIVLPAAVISVPSGVGLEYYIDRMGPLWAPLPFRESDAAASGAGTFNVALFEIVTEYDGRDDKLGYLETWQGVALKMPASMQYKSGTSTP